MKLLLLAWTAFLGLAASGSAARAVPFDFTYTGSLVTFTVPTTDTYQILAFGAQGGSGTFCAITCFIGAGGRGAEIGGNFSLTAGEILQIAVGGAGGNGIANDAGGGGGSFIVGPSNTPLVIAGGGGGGGAFIFGPVPGLVVSLAPMAAVGKSATVAPTETVAALAVAVAGFSAPAASFPSAQQAKVVVDSPVSLGVWAALRATAAAVSAAGVVVVRTLKAAQAVVVATVAAAAASLATLAVALPAVADPSTRGPTRSWSPISRPATARW